MGIGDEEVAEHGDAGFGVHHAGQNVLGHGRFEKAVGVAALAGQAAAVLRGMLTVGFAVVVEDALPGLVIDGRAFAFVERVPDAQTAGENAAEVTVAVDEQNVEPLARGPHGHGDAAGGAAEDDEIVILAVHIRGRGSAGSIGLQGLAWRIDDRRMDGGGGSRSLHHLDRRVA